MNNQQQQMGTGLARYRSAPSSYFTSFLNNNTFGGGFGTDHDFEHLFSTTTPLVPPPPPVAAAATVQETAAATASVSVPKLISPRPPKPKLHRHRSNDYSSSLMYNQTSTTITAATSGNKQQQKSGLVRQSSSPAGLFDNINIEKEFGGLTGMGSFGASNNSNAERGFSGLTNRRSSGMMAPISETGTEGIGESNPVMKKDEGDYLQDFPMNSWDDSSLLSDSFLKELTDQSDEKPFSDANASDVQEEEGGNQSTTSLSRHLSMPTSSSELSAMEKLLHDTVPFKIRAKRGCATHPRSIAERVRRTKISDRIRKLQELVPNMEKQTNTSDMLDLAVDYIKDLQTQVKKLSDARARCCCLARQRL